MSCSDKMLGKKANCNKSIKSNFYLPAETKVKVIAYHKFSDKQFTQIMTFAEWLKFERSKNYDYKCLQIDL